MLHCEFVLSCISSDDMPLQRVFLTVFFQLLSEIFVFALQSVGGADAVTRHERVQMKVDMQICASHHAVDYY